MISYLCCFPKINNCLALCCFWVNSYNYFIKASTFWNIYTTYWHLPVKSSSNYYLFALEGSHICWTLWKVILSAWVNNNAFINNYRYWRTNYIFFITNDISAVGLCTSVTLVEWEGGLCQLLLSHTEMAFWLCFACLICLSDCRCGCTVQYYEADVLKTSNPMGLIPTCASQFFRIEKCWRTAFRKCFVNIFGKQ